MFVYILLFIYLFLIFMNLLVNFNNINLTDSWLDCLDGRTANHKARNYTR
jgi:hypothetical protein